MTIRRGESFGDYSARVVAELHRLRRNGNTTFARLDSMLAGDIPLEPGFALKTWFEDCRRDLLNELKLLRRGWCIAARKQVEWEHPRR